MIRLVQYVCGLIAAFIFGLYSLGVRAQVSGQKQLTTSDYKLWHTLYMGAVSDDGKWISYSLRYESGADTLFLKNVDSGKCYAYPKSGDVRFAADHTFACLEKGQNLLLRNLRNGKSVTIPGVSEYQFSANGKYLISNETSEARRHLCFRNCGGALIIKIENVTEYKLSHNYRKVLYSTDLGGKFSTGIVDLDSVPTNKPISGLTEKVSGAAWSDMDDVVAFYIGEEKDFHIGMYFLGTNMLKMLDSLPKQGFDNQSICKSDEIPLKVSDDGKRVFFAVRHTDFAVPEKPIVEIWNGNATYLYPQLEQMESYNRPFLAVWNTFEDLVMQVSNEHHPWAMLTGDNNFALTGDPGQYQPQYKLFADMDYYITDLENGTRSLLAEKVSSHPTHVSASPDGKFVAYYSEGNWWVYEIRTHSKLNLTDGLGISFDSTDSDPGNELAVYGIAGWSVEGKSIFIYDQFDLWHLSIDGKLKEKLTSGRNKSLRYRLIPTDNSVSNFNYNGMLSANCDLNQSMVFSAVDVISGDSGYFIRGMNGKMKMIAFESAEISDLYMARNGNVYMYKRQRYETPPEIVISGSGKVVIKSNKQHQKYFRGRSEMIRYRNHKGQTLSAALFCPANYNPNLKYPMIVYIYDKLSKMVHHYVNPSERSGYGFNTAQFTANGYFVLMPDIAYEVGNTGRSAADCVTAAVEEVLSRGNIDAGKVGLYGHSFGGYETNFIITQTQIFAAAVSGSGVSDVQRDYFTLNSEFLNAEAWRFENQQYRMGKSFYEIPQQYIDNSPINNAADINTPLLVWTGGNDNNVKPEQSVAFFIALKRLKKKCIMLVYPGQGHILTGTQQQEDLNRKVLQWFDHFLKGNKSGWVDSGTTDYPCTK